MNDKVLSMILLNMAQDPPNLGFSVELNKRFELLSQLQLGWDPNNPESERPSLEILEIAKQIILETRNEFDEPTIGASTDAEGGIELYWMNLHVYLDLYNNKEYMMAQVARCSLDDSVEGRFENVQMLIPIVRNFIQKYCGLEFNYSEL